MLLDADVEDDLIEKFPEFYSRENNVLIYQNGKDNSKFAVFVKVYQL